MEPIVLQLFIAAVCGLIAAAIASSKGRSGVGWFFGGFFLGLIGIIIVACLSNLTNEREYRQRVDRDNRRLREQLHQERLKNEAFREFTAGRLDQHDLQLGVDTRTSPAALSYSRPASSDDDPGAFLKELAQSALPPEPPPPPPVATSPLQSADQPPRRWHFEENGESHGPVSEEYLQRMMQSGRLNGATLVWHEQLGDWQPARSIPSLQPYLRS